MILVDSKKRLQTALDAAAAVRRCFVKFDVSDREASDLAYLVRLADAGRTAKELTHGDDHEELRGAVRTILRIVPGMIAQSDALAEVAAREARSTDLDQFSLRAKDLLAAAQHFKAVSVANTRSKRSWWHGWARDFAFEVWRVLIRNGVESPGFSNPTSQGITITLELLKLASISDIDPTALIAALKQKTKRKLKKVS